MEDIKVQLCECGCGKPSPIATRNWHKRGIKKGQPLRFICGHHRRGKEQSKEEKLKRVRKWGVTDAEISPYLPGNKIIRFYPNQKRWYCSSGKSSSKIPHARLVYKHYFGNISDEYVVHHKSGSAEKIEDDRPDNLILVSKTWNLHYFPHLAKGFNVPESKVTECYIKVSEIHQQEEIFKEVCRMLLEVK